MSKLHYFRSSVTLPTWRVKSSHTPQCSPEWELGHRGTKTKKGAYGLETTPPPWSVKHSSPNTAQGSYPHWSAGNGLSPRQCPSPPAHSVLNWPSMQRVARVEERAGWIGIRPRKAGFCLFLLQQAITKQWGVNSFPPPHVLKCGPWSLTPILMPYFKLSHLTLGYVQVLSNWESNCSLSCGSWLC